jgi:hypothetical protein
MANFLLVVEGAHDAAFFGHLLRGRGYKRVEFIGNIPQFWRKLIPEKYPVSENGYLGRFVKFPDFYSDASAENWIAISLAGGKDELIETLRVPIELHSIADFSALGIVLDADWELTCGERFERFRQQLDSWNFSASRELAGFPLSLPDAAGGIAAGPPRFGVFVFPDNNRQGTLDTVLLACAASSYPVIHQQADSLLSVVASSALAREKDLEKFQTIAGREKAHAGIIANVLHPGSSLAVSIRQSHWLHNAESSEPLVAKAAKFLDGLLKP